MKAAALCIGYLMLWLAIAALLSLDRWFWCFELDGKRVMQIGSLIIAWAKRSGAIDYSRMDVRWRGVIVYRKLHCGLLSEMFRFRYREWKDPYA
jgi:hypothetical protein